MMYNYWGSFVATKRKKDEKKKNKHHDVWENDSPSLPFFPSLSLSKKIVT